MKTYDSIPYFGDHWGLPIIAFDKIDGSNLRFEYSHKKGFYKVGTRKMMIDSTHPTFGFALNLFLEKYSDELSKIFSTKEYRNIQSFVCFAELHGTKSEFGWHDYDNDEFDITLFDINAYKRGFIPPKELIENFSTVKLPKVIYEGILNKEFVNKVKENEFGLSEGVICKGEVKTKKGNDNLFYCKIKTNDWFERLRNRFPDQYNEEIR